VHKQALFGHLRQRWQDLFAAKFDILLYDLTSTYFECDPPENEGTSAGLAIAATSAKDCVQVVTFLPQSRTPIEMGPPGSPPGRVQ
jgi:hypothetical protein